MSLQSATARVAAIQARIGATPGRNRGGAEFEGLLSDVQRHAGVSPQDADPVADNLQSGTVNYQSAGLGAEQNALLARLMGSGTQTLGSMVSGGQDLNELLALLGGQNNGVVSALPGLAAVQPATLERGAAVLPGFDIGSKYGNRMHPIAKVEKFHHGVDIGAPSGTPISSYADGTVTFAGARGGYGNLVIVDHGDGVETRYAHQSQIGVQVGDQLAAGQTLGFVGSTGSSTAPHLHFELREHGSSVDPAPYLAATGMRLKGDH